MSIDLDYKQVSSLLRHILPAKRILHQQSMELWLCRSDP